MERQKFEDRVRIWITLALCFLAGNFLGALVVNLYWRYGGSHLALGILQLSLYEKENIKQQELFMFLLYRYEKVQFLFYLTGFFSWGYLLSGMFLLISGFLFGYLQTAVLLLNGISAFLHMFAFSGLQILLPGIVLMFQMERIWSHADLVPGRKGLLTKWAALYAGRCIFFSACMILAVWIESHAICTIITKIT